ncbi:MAG: hypothetical protein NC037_00690 [Bacteroides sp.]|nr:hypothetical protein [Bacillota bacterium]MCM1394343.1 hypothetical protein [[Eubacterium] siraeum]MCM1455035.1 hypothetical protein [Bacteroides sp.]
MMTLDELLGNQTQTAERFPSYEEFASSRNRSYARNESDVIDSYDQFGYAPSAVIEDEYVPSYTQDIIRPYTRNQNFYEYVARQNKETTDADLYARLSRSNESLRPVFDRNESAEMTAAFQNTKADQKKRGRLNTKGKLIVGAFVALVITTVSLIIAFAGKINSGTAVVPASNAGAVSVSVQSANL